MGIKFEKNAFSACYEVKINGLQVGLISKSMLKGWSLIWFNTVLMENNMPTFNNDDLIFPTLKEAKQYAAEVLEDCLVPSFDEVMRNLDKAMNFAFV